MRRFKGFFKIFSIVMVSTILLVSFPSNVSGNPLDLSGFERFGNNVVQIAGDIWDNISSFDWFRLIPDPSKQFLNQPNPVFEKSTALAVPDKDIEIKSPSERITLRIPAGAFEKEIEIEFIEYGLQESTGMASSL